MPATKIMIVDDSAAIRTKLKRLFFDNGFDVIEASDGCDALEILDESFDLMVLDVNMPHLDGYGVCERIREAGQKYDRLPIVFLTSMENRALELLGHQFGAYLAKPVQERELLNTVQQLLDSTKSSPVNA